jgi:hypothetical protein
MPVGVVKSCDVSDRNWISREIILGVGLVATDTPAQPTAGCARRMIDTRRHKGDFRHHFQLASVLN